MGEAGGVARADALKAGALDHVDAVGPRARGVRFEERLDAPAEAFPALWLLGEDGREATGGGEAGSPVSRFEEVGPAGGHGVGVADGIDDALAHRCAVRVGSFLGDRAAHCIEERERRHIRRCWRRLRGHAAIVPQEPARRLSSWSGLRLTDSTALHAMADRPSTMLRSSRVVMFPGARGHGGAQEALDPRGEKRDMAHAAHGAQINSANQRALKISAALTGVYFVIELVAGILIGSVAVLVGRLSYLLGGRRRAGSRWWPRDTPLGRRPRRGPSAICGPRYWARS